MVGQKPADFVRAITGCGRPNHPVDRRLVLLTRLTIVQVALLTLGLWLHDHFLVAAAEMQARNARAELAAGGSPHRGSPLAADIDGRAQASDLVEMMPSTRCFTLAWVACLQASAAFLVYCRIWKQAAQTENHATEILARQERELVRTRDAIIFGLARLADSRDSDTGKHLERIASYSTRLAAELRKLPAYRDRVTPAFVKLIGVSSALHDIGKVGISDAILLKPGRFTPEERTQMQTHAVRGGDCIREIERQLGGATFLQMAREIAYAHHERWDGEGYPFGLAGDRIPLAARIVAIADVYDALSVRRVYKSALPHEQCVAIILDQSGKQFDPALVEIFLGIAGEFRRIAEQFAESGSAPPAETGKPRAPLALIESQEPLQLYLAEAEESPAREAPAAQAL